MIEMEISPSKVDQLIGILQECADVRLDFFDAKGAGIGDLATNAYTGEVRQRALVHFEADFSERKICGDNQSAVDFYFPDEATIVEVALGLKNPQSEFEKDILKALLAKEKYPVKRLVLVGKKGAVRQCSQPIRVAFKEWALRHHGLTVDVVDIHPKGESNE